MTFCSEVKKHDPFWFWNHILEYENTHDLYFGNLNSNDDCDLKMLIEGLLKDLKKKVDRDSFYLKLFYDLDRIKKKPLLHFLLIVDRQYSHDLKKTILYGTSKLNLIEKVSRFKDTVNHYLGHHDYYNYINIDKYNL